MLSWKESYEKYGPVCPVNDFLEKVVHSITEAIDNLNKEKKHSCKIPNEIEFDIPLDSSGGVHIREEEKQHSEKRVKFTVPIVS